MKFASLLCVLFAFTTTVFAQSVAPTAVEMDEAHRWVAAKFDGIAPAEDATPRIEVLDNHGPVQANHRGEKPLQLGATPYPHGLYCHAPSKLVVHLPGPAKSFEAVAGVDTNDQTSGGRGSVQYSVIVGGAEVWHSDVLREGMPGVPVAAALGGAKGFALAVSDGGDGISCDQADWADARVTLQNGSIVWLGDLPIQEQSRDAYTTEPFFAFTYGDKSSADFLSAWKVERRLRAIDDARKEHTLTYTDPATGLVVRCIGVEYLDFSTVEWTLYFKNGGTADTPILSEIQAIDTQFTRNIPLDPPSKGDNAIGEFVLHHNTGDICAAESYQPLVDMLAPKSETRIANTGGRPTQTAFPYFNIASSDGGVICVVSWAGQWSADFTRDDSTGLRIRAGQELTHFTLHPGEEVRSPMVVLQFYKGDWLRAQNIWRRWMLAHNQPRPAGKPLKPHSSLCTGNFYPGLMTEATQEKAFLQRHLDERIPFDCWWQDAGWYPCDNAGWPKVGTWEVDPVRFPKGLREISDMMHANGKKTMVWFEPERVAAGTWITDNHPEWVFGGKDGGLLKLGEPACRAWLTDHIDKLLTDQGIDYYRQDFNIDPLSYWRANDTEDRQGISEIRHVEGYFAYWDELLRRHPGMLIDSCASGGRRNDLETLRRAVPLLRSDWYAGPAGMQGLTYGLSMWIPYHGNGFIYEQDEYWIRSAMVAEMSYGPSAEGVDKFDFARLRKMTEEHLRIAPYFLGDFYPLTLYSLDESQWMAWQYDRADLGEGVVQVFRRKDSVYEAARFRLHAIDEKARYQITNLDDGTSVELAGAELVREGFRVTAEKQPGALAFVYKRLP